jgi:hypothetical protein
MLTPPAWPEDWLSSERFATYLNATDGDQRAALALYEWNSVMSLSVMHDLGQIEVGLRNAYDRALNAAVPSGRHWTTDLMRFFPVALKQASNGRVIDINERPRHQVETAIRSASKTAARRPRADPRRTKITGGDVIVHLPFGFWRYLSTAAQQKPLWVPYLRHGLHNQPARKKVDRHVDLLHQLRNKVAHYEPILAYNLDARRSDVIALAPLLASELAAHIDTTSTWLEILGQRPA